MKVSKWVDFGQEVEIEITMEDVRAAISESFSAVTQDRLGESGPTPGEVTRALNSVATFLRALTDDHIKRMTSSQIEIVQKFFAEAALRFQAAAIHGRTNA